MRPVESSSVARIGWDEAAGEVHVEFHDGDRYAYSGVPRLVWLDFERAPSKGKFLNEVIKRYPYRRL